MHNYADNYDIFVSLSLFNDEDLYDTKWVNMKAISQYNSVYLENAPSILKNGKNGYAVFNTFKYKGFRIPYKLRISNGLYDDDSFNVSLSPYPHILFCYIKIELTESVVEILPYIPISDHSIDDEYLYIYSDNVDVLVLGAIYIKMLQLYEANERVYLSNDYHSNLTLYRLGKLEIVSYLELLGFVKV